MLKDMLEAIEAHPIILLAVASLVVVVVISIERFITLYITFRLRVPPLKKALEQALVEMDINKGLRIDHAHVQRTLAGGLRRAKTDHAAHQTRALERQRKRAAHQAAAH